MTSSILRSSKISLFNSLSQKIETVDFSKPFISWYTCGPTVYDVSHIGHARTYVTVDLLRRSLQWISKKPVIHAMNITNIDDKIIKRAREEKVDPLSLANKYEREFFRDMKSLGVENPALIPRVSESIENIHDFIDVLLKKDYAYISNDGVYMDVGKVGTRYGRLIPNMTSDSLRSSEPEIREKRDPRDFALWKFISQGDSEFREVWDSPWGTGRPGWHIECSAMIHSAFGGPIDIHSGGLDLRFPHHCNEMCQSEVFYGFPNQAEGEEQGEWVKSWVHVGQLSIEGLKMSKSLKNYISIDSLLNSSLSIPSNVSLGDAFRMYCAFYPYHSSLSYTESSLQEAALHLSKIVQCMSTISSYTSNVKSISPVLSNTDKLLLESFGRFNTSVEENLSCDLRIDLVVRELLDLIRVIHFSIGDSSARTHTAVLKIIQTGIQSFMESLGFQVFSMNDTKTTDLGGADILSIREFSKFRHDIRGIVISSMKTKTDLIDSQRIEVQNEAFNRIMTLCDEARSKTFPSLGFSLQDSKLGPIISKIKDH